MSARKQTVQPVRIRRSRLKGQRLLSPNGLPVVCVSRPSKWGNPFAIEPSGTKEQDSTRRAIAAARFRAAIQAQNPKLPFSLEEVRRELRGKNVACWCPLDGPCHGDVLLELANS